MNYAFINGKILDGTKDMQVQSGLYILVQDGIITDIVPGTADLQNYSIIDLQGNYILPGLINMHVHLAGNGKPQKKQRDNEKLVNTIMGSSLTRKIAYKMVSGFAKDELLSGVTTIRTVGGLGDFDTRLRDEIEAGTKTGPRILAANQGISVPGGHMAGSVAIAAETADDALSQLAKSEEEKVDLIKLFKERGAFLCTTISPALPYALFDRSVTNATEVEQYNGNVVFEGIIACAKAALEHDIPVVLGNDVGCPWITQYDFWRELYYFHKYVGVSNAFAIYTATRRSAELAGIGHITGSIEKGKSADMLVISGNPLEDLRALRYPEMVITRGTILNHPKIRKRKQVEAELDKFL